jgi:hypothetical protein
MCASQPKVDGPLQVDVAENRAMTSPVVLAGTVIVVVAPGTSTNAVDVVVAIEASRTTRTEVSALPWALLEAAETEATAPRSTRGAARSAGRSRASGGRGVVAQHIPD